MYDYLIVGAGLFGSVFAREMAERGKSALSSTSAGILAGIFPAKR